MIASIAAELSDSGYHLVIDELKKGVVVINRNGIISDTSKKFCDMVGCTKNKLIGEYIVNLLDSKEENCPQKMFRIFDRQDPIGSREYEVSISTSNGARLNALMVLMPVRNSENSFKKVMALFVGIKQNCRLKKISDFSNSRLEEIGLTRAELSVAGLVKMQKTTKEIARSLFLSERTVSNHRQNIRRKLGLQVISKKIEVKLLHNQAEPFRGNCQHDIHTEPQYA